MKPCPICNKQPSIWTYELNGTRFFWVECSNLHCEACTRQHNNYQDAEDQWNDEDFRSKMPRHLWKSP